MTSGIRKWLRIAILTILAGNSLYASIMANLLYSQFLTDRYFDQIRQGMRKKDVIAFIGTPTVQSCSKVGNCRDVWQYYPLLDIGYMEIDFDQDGFVKDKLHLMPSPDYSAPIMPNYYNPLIVGRIFSQ